MSAEEDSQTTESPPASENMPLSFQSPPSDVNFEELLKFFAVGVKIGPTYDLLQMQCIQLINRDYDTLVIDAKGSLCSSYPRQIIVPCAEKYPHPSFSSVSPDLAKALSSETDLHNLFMTSKPARCRERFVVPVFLFNNKVVCRSATLSTYLESVGRQVLSSGRQVLSSVTGSVRPRTSEGSDSVATDSEPLTVEREQEEDEQQQQQPPTQAQELPEQQEVGDQEPMAEPAEPGLEPEEEQVPAAVDKKNLPLDAFARHSDARLMTHLNVGEIFDLMVEDKKVKYMLYCSSSEKVDEYNLYCNFHINCIPYPGCEYFKEVAHNKFNPEGMIFNWEQPAVTSQCQIPYKSNLDIDWSQYKTWDLAQLTQNYLLLILHCLADKNSSAGVLVHCISGWDRTPMFICLLRLSLWADGAIHQSLCAREMLLLTLAYDWMLFGHQFQTRLAAGEPIFYFCFNFLRFIEDERYSVIPSDKADDSSRQTRKGRLSEIRELFLSIYQKAESHGHFASSHWSLGNAVLSSVRTYLQV
eukprot:scpid59590/ scgid17239/ Myotubularin-related protein 14; mJumpy